MCGYFGFVMFIIGITFSSINWSTSADYSGKAADDRSTNVKAYNAAVNAWKSGTYYSDFDGSPSGTFQVTASSNTFLQKTTPADEIKDVKQDDYLEYSSRISYTASFAIPSGQQSVQLTTGVNSYLLTVGPATMTTSYPYYDGDFPTVIYRTGKLYDCKISSDDYSCNPSKSSSDSSECDKFPLCQTKCESIHGTWDPYKDQCAATAYLKNMCFRVEEGSGSLNWKLKGLSAGSIIIDSSDLRSDNVGCYYGSKDKYLGIDDYFPGVYEYVPAQLARQTVTLELRHDKDPYLVLESLSEGTFSLTVSGPDGFQLWLADSAGSIPLILSIVFFVICCIMIAKQPKQPAATINPDPTAPNAPPVPQDPSNIGYMKPAMQTAVLPNEPPPAYDPTNVQVQIPMPMPMITGNAVYSNPSIVMQQPSYSPYN